MDFFQKKPHRESLELQLTAMIDIFSMLVIFLIFGTVIGGADIIFPANLQLPFSRSKESTESAPQVVITNTQVIVSVLNNKELATGTFRESSDANAAILASLENELKEYLKKSNEKTKVAGQALNVVADQNLDYRTLFQVIRVFRQAGFESLLFIAKEGAQAR